MLVLTWGVVVGPEMAARFKPASLRWLADTGWFAVDRALCHRHRRHRPAALAYHLWLAAGRRRLADVWPGVVLSVVLWVLAARLFGSWLTVSDYSRFYAGLTQIMSALVFFQVSAIIVILGAELNRGLLEIGRSRRATPSPLERSDLQPPRGVSRSACGFPRWRPRTCAGPWSAR